MCERWNPSRGLLNAANIAPVLQEKIGREIEAHSIMPFWMEVSGSGTLVTIDGVHRSDGWPRSPELARCRG